MCSTELADYTLKKHHFLSALSEYYNYFSWEELSLNVNHFVIIFLNVNDQSPGGNGKDDLNTPLLGLWDPLQQESDRAANPHILPPPSPVQFHPASSCCPARFGVFMGSRRVASSHRLVLHKGQKRLFSQDPLANCIGGLRSVFPHKDSGAQGPLCPKNKLYKDRALRQSMEGAQLNTRALACCY